MSLQSASHGPSQASTRRMNSRNSVGHWPVPDLPSSGPFQPRLAAASRPASSLINPKRLHSGATNQGSVHRSLDRGLEPASDLPSVLQPSAVWSSRLQPHQCGQSLCFEEWRWDSASDRSFAAESCRSGRGASPAPTQAEWPCQARIAHPKATEPWRYRQRSLTVLRSVA
jgi:hypothetical protein